MNRQGGDLPGPDARTVEVPNVHYPDGITDSWRSFEPVLPHLPASIHAFALTHRDHGDANRPAAGYRYHDFAADVAAFMDALGIDSAVFEGSFMGSSVASNSPWTTPSGPSGSC